MIYRSRSILLFLLFLLSPIHTLAWDGEDHEEIELEPGEKIRLKDVTIVCRGGAFFCGPCVPFEYKGYSDGSGAYSKAFYKVYDAAGKRKSTVNTGKLFKKSHSYALRMCKNMRKSDPRCN